MNDKELKEVWMSQSASIPFDNAQLLGEIRKRTDKFDRRVRRRNWVEWATGALVVAPLTAAAFVVDGLVRVGCLVSVGAVLWVAYFIKRYGTAAPDPDPHMSLAEYRQALLEKYDRQIWLLKNVKYWYLLPLYTSVMLIFTGALLRMFEARGFFVARDFVPMAIGTGMMLFVWWLNEGYGVRKLRREREETRQRLDQLNGDEPAQTHEGPR